ncbi:hypothetical protein STCU_10591 [Strigomonas culicis]|uniref:Uncharacterized protein n=1 Tax=Strigomonas culicis TaxID=28005 RepID=S9V3Q3_9TRYP|nr:hypothetical protein STCU_10591 [Strigomonas culicis]|eukprot:EPY17485.1 hypothetical protein STCU_10591 [Strigomonas culicis]
MWRICVEAEIRFTLRQALYIGTSTGDDGCTALVYVCTVRCFIDETFFFVYVFFFLEKRKKKIRTERTIFFQLK